MDNRITRRFAARKSDERLLSLFLTAGFPDPNRSEQIIRACIESGADLLELGMPYSDPLADGPVIQNASQKALSHGVELPWILDLVRRVRTWSEIPILLMGYFNPVLSYGVERFCKDAASAGADGLILPDLPLEEMRRVLPFADALGLTTVGLITPTTTEQRIRDLDEVVSGFLYTVLVTGVTGGSLNGAGEGGTESIPDFLARIRPLIKRNPLMAGFGIRSREDVQPLAPHVDGYIVGSALLRLIADHEEDPELEHRVRTFVRSLVYHT